MGIELTFGVELELLLRPHPPLIATAQTKYGFDAAATTEVAKNQSRAALRAAVVDVLRNAEIEANADSSDYSAWTVVDEISLDEPAGFWRCEVVSGILSTSITWQDHINQLFAALADACDIMVTPDCGMHIHVSSPGSDGRLPTPELASIMKGTLFYDAPITRIMPSHRKDSPWAKSNVLIKTKQWKKQVAEMPKHSWAPLFDPLDKAKMKGVLLHDLCNDRYVSWNFAKTLDVGTVEFRRPPPAQTAAEAKHWAAFTLGFIANAIAVEKWGDVKNLKQHPTTAELRAAVKRGIETLGAHSQGALGSIEDIDAPAIVLSAAEQRRIDDLKKAKKNKQSVFVEKMSSRPNTPTSGMVAA